MQILKDNIVTVSGAICLLHKSVACFLCRFILDFILALAVETILMMAIPGHFLDAFMMTERFILLTDLLLRQNVTQS